jgi:hypothetical protein
VVKKLIIILILAAAAFAVYWFFLRSSDESVIRKNVESLAWNASKMPGEGTTAMLIKTQVLESLFADKCALSVRVPEIDGDYSREEISSKAALCRRNFKSAVISFRDLTVTVAKDKSSAKAVMTACFEGVPSSGEKIFQAREVEAVLKKIDGKWLFFGFSLVEVLKK